MVRYLITLKEIAKLSSKVRANPHNIKDFKKADSIFRYYEKNNININNFSQIINIDFFIKKFDKQDQIFIQNSLIENLTEQLDFGDINEQYNSEDNQVKLLSLNNVGSNLKGLQSINGGHPINITALEYIESKSEINMLFNHYSHGMDNVYNLYKNCKIGQKVSLQNIKDNLNDPEFNS
jgi:hypothetical protein